MLEQPTPQNSSDWGTESGTSIEALLAESRAALERGRARAAETDAILRRSSLRTDVELAKMNGRPGLRLVGAPEPEPESLPDNVVPFRRP